MDKPISMTTFVDFAVATPGSKVGVVKDARRLYEGGYKWVKDPYRGLKEALVEALQEGRPPTVLRRAVAKAPEDMEAHWTACVEGVVRFVGRRKFMWRSKPKPVEWSSGGLTVKVNPELGLTINGQPHVIKLYFKDAKVAKIRVNSMLQLLQQNFPTAGTVGILDVRRGKLFTPPVPTTTLILLHGEAASFVEIWRRLEGPGPNEITAVS